MDDKQNWEWLEKIEDRIKAIPSSEKVLKDYTFTFGIPLIGSPSLIDIQEKAYLNEDHKGLIQLIQCVRTLREALEFYGERSSWELDSGIWDLSELDTEPGRANEQPGMRARAALKKAAKGEFE